MAMPALKLEQETPVEQRVAVLETNVEHIKSDTTDLKTDVRRLNDKVDAVDNKLTAKIDAVDKKLTDKIDALEKAFNEFRITVEKAFADLRISRAYDRVWWMLIAGMLLGVMARGFKWI